METQKTTPKQIIHVTARVRSVWFSKFINRDKSAHSWRRNTLIFMERLTDKFQHKLFQRALSCAQAQEQHHTLKCCFNYAVKSQLDEQKHDGKHLMTAWAIMSMTNVVFTAHAWMDHRHLDAYYTQKWQDLSEITSFSVILISWLTLYNLIQDMQVFIRWILKCDVKGRLLYIHFTFLKALPLNK